MLNDFCSPSLLYVCFSLIHIFIDMYKGVYNLALLKFIIMIVFSLVLNILCNTGLTIIAWFLVFIPIILMTLITTLLLYIIGLSSYNENAKISNSNLYRQNTSNENTKYGREVIDTTPLLFSQVGDGDINKYLEISKFVKMP